MGFAALNPSYMPSRDPLVTLDLGAMHDPSRLRIERVAAVQDSEIVPHQHIAYLPLMAHGEPLLRRMRPQHVEQRLAVGDTHPSHVAVRPAAKKQNLSARLPSG